MFVLAILINLLWHHSVVFNLHFPNNNVKHLFMFLFAIHIFSLIKCHCKSFAHFFFKIGHIVFVLLPSESIYVNWICLSSHMWFQKFLPVHSLCLLILLAMSYIGQKSSFQCNSIYQSFFFFLLWIMLLILYLRNVCLIQDHKCFILCFLLVYRLFMTIWFKIDIILMNFSDIWVKRMNYFLNSEEYWI